VIRTLTDLSSILPFAGARRAVNVARADDRQRQELLESHGDTVIRTTWTG
jgi:hypothetical protein